MKAKSLALLFSPLALFCTDLAAQHEERQTPSRQAQTAEPLELLGKRLGAAVESAASGIVHITARQLRAVSPSRTERTVAMQVEESGSGVIAEIEGRRIILTNRHVVQGIELGAITIRTHDRKILTPTKMVTNEDYDLALIEVSEKLPAAVDFADSDKIGVGDFVLAVGSPFGLDRSVSLGIISAKNRRNIPSSNKAPRVGFLQLDAAVNPGSSGGPVLNLRGEVVGLVTAIATQSGGYEGVAFALPSNLVRRVTRQMLQNDGVGRKPHVGLAFDREFPMTDRRRLGIDREIGTRINRVVQNSPATLAGLQVGDVILQFDGTEVEDDLHFVVLVAEAEIGKAATLIVNRTGHVFSVDITPTAAPIAGTVRE